MVETTKLPVRKERGSVSDAGQSSFERLRREMDRLFSEMGRGSLFLPARWTMPDLGPIWQRMEHGLEPVVDFVERPDRYEIKAELPGLDEKNIEVKLSNGNLIISGEKREESDEKGASYHVSERRYGSFQRSFQLPAGVDPGKIDATFQKGVLTISIPKTEEAKQETKIVIKAA